MGRPLRVKLLKTKLVVSKTSPTPAQALPFYGYSQMLSSYQLAQLSLAGDSLPHKPEAGGRERNTVV